MTGMLAGIAWMATGCGGLGLEPFNGVVGAIGLEVEPESQVVFPDSPVSRPATQQEVLLIAVGDEAVVVTQVYLSGEDADEFSLPDLPFPRAIQAGTELPLRVGFTPPSVQQFRASLVVVAEDAGMELSRTIVGKGCPDTNGDNQCDPHGPPLRDTDEDTGW